LALVQRLGDIDDLRWIRLLYLYAGLLPTAAMRELLACQKVVPYLDMPIQHASPRLLTAMKRPGDSEAAERCFNELRRERPDLVLRTTILLGFPGEEEEDIEQLADFLARVEFDHLGTYRYSPEADTPAALLPGRVSPEEVADREALILDLQAEIALRRQERRLDGEFTVVIDEVSPAAETQSLLAALHDGTWHDTSSRDDRWRDWPATDEMALGRSQHYGYDLDGVVVLPRGSLSPGDWVRARFLVVTPFDTGAEVV
jgi:ribosomal protein S12 methylthiotransferase